MSQKRDWYNIFSQIFGWEEHRKSRLDCSVIGFPLGIFVVFGALSVVTLIFARFNPLSIGILLAIIAGTAIATLSILIIWFGYKDLKSVIKNSFFRYSFLTGTLIMLIAMVIVKIKIAA